MPPQSSLETRKALAFVGVVLASLAAILAANVAIHDRTTTFSEGVGTPLRDGLERLIANPTKCAMTLEPGPDNERPMRRVYAGLIPRPDVLVLGQSDADHMTQSLFKDDVRFYNGFVSTSYFVLQYEVFDELMRAHGAPPFVLLDVRSGFVLREGDEAAWDSPANSAIWWGFPAFHLGRAKPPPWYRDIPSLLSLAQTQLTLGWLSHQLPTKPPAIDFGDTEVDNGSQFRCIDLNKKSGMYRWLVDGSRVYGDEVGGVLPPPGQVHINEALGERHVNPNRLVGLEWVLRRLHDAGATVIVYSPPVNPRSYQDVKQVKPFQEFGAAIRAVTDRNGLDFCDFTLKADAIGCGAGDFSDEVHISRHCDQRILREMTLGCAPKTGAKLASKLAAATLK